MNFYIPSRKLLPEFLAAICIIVCIGCGHIAKAGSVVYVDCQIESAQTATYNPDSRTCGPGKDTAYKTLKAAADNVSPGQTVIIREGEYNQSLRPKQSGQIDNYICFKNFPGEKPVITGASLEPAVDISNRSYLIIEGLNITNVRRWLYAINSSYNIIRNNHFSKAIDPGGSSKTGLFFQQAKHNVLVGNTIEDSTQDNLSLIKSDRNIIKNNTFRKAKHTLWTIKGGNFNVIRDNYFHNELQKIGEVLDCHNVGFNHEFYEYDCTRRNLIERNIFAYTPSSGSHSSYAGIQYAGQKGIIRNNLFYDTVGPCLNFTLYGEEANYNAGNRVYNNVFYGSEFAGILLSASKRTTFKDNIIKNNILSGSKFVANDTRWEWWKNTLSGKPVQMLAGRLEGFLCQNNNFFSASEDSEFFITLGSTKPLIRPQVRLAMMEDGCPEVFKDNKEFDPLFVDIDKRDFHLRHESPMIDAGAFLTQVADDGSGKYLPVEDVSYFYDGYHIAGEVGDLIRLESQDCVARIIDIDYERNILELSQSLVWRKGQGVSLYYIGARPDLGAFEFIPGGAQPPVAEFTAYYRDDDPLTVDIDASASCDADGNIVKYNWDFGDGSCELKTDAKLSHTYIKPGMYNITLRVFDNGQPQQTGIATLTVSVGKPVLELSKKNIEFGPVDKIGSFELKNTGEGTLFYRISTSDSWLTIKKPSGNCTTQAKTILVGVNREDLKVGRREGRLTIDAGSAGVRNIEVSITVPNINAVELISIGDNWKYIKGVAEPPVIWNRIDLDDTFWLEGPSGIGYSTEMNYPTILDDMKDNYRSVYMRRLFEVSDVNSITVLELAMRYDDGFVAYLNGNEVARSSSMGPAGATTGFMKEALFSHDEEEQEEYFNIEIKPGLLSTGKNVLAIELHNNNKKSSDACAVPRLIAKMICD